MKKLLAALVLLLFVAAMGLLVFRDSLMSRVVPAVASRFHISLQLQGLHLGLNPLVLRLGRVDARWEGGEAHLLGVRLHLSLFPLSLRELHLNRGEVRIVGGGGSKGFVLPHKLEKVDLEDLSLEVEASWGRLDLEGVKVFLGPDGFSLKGLVSYLGGWGEFRGRFSFAGEGDSLVQAQPKGSGWLEGRLIVGDRSLQGSLHLPSVILLPKVPKVEVKDAALVIPTLFEAHGDLLFVGGGWRLRGEGRVLSLHLLRPFLPSLPEGMEGILRFSGEAAWDGELAYSVEVEGGRLRGEGLGGLKRVEVSFGGHLEGEGGRGQAVLRPLVLTKLVLPWGKEEGWCGEGKLAWKDWGRKGVEGGVWLHRGTRGVEVTISFPSLGLRGAWMRLKAEGFPVTDLKKWRASVPPILGDVALKGSIKGEVDVSYGGGKWRARGWCQGEGLAFSTPEGNGGEGLEIRMDFSSSQDAVKGPWHLSLSLLKGQVLASYWFLDFSRGPWTLSLDVARERGRICVRQAKYRGLAQVDFSGDFCLPGGGKGVVVFSGDVGNLYTQLVAEPLGENEPLLKELTPQGDVRGSFSFGWRGGLRVKGEVRWKGLVRARAFFLKGGILLPLIYTSEGRGKGELQVEALTLGPVDLEGWNTPLEGLPYLLRGLKGYRLSLWGGEVDWGPFSLSYRDLKDPKFEIDGLEVKGLRPPQSPLPVVVEGRFPRVRGGREGIFLDGGAEVRVAKGVVRITKLRVLHPFTPLMKIGCDVEFSHLDLEELTKVTPFGRVTGYIKGYVKDLVISHGQPESFQLRVETQEVKGVKKRISLKAINSISILGGGGPVSMFLPFFKEFGYSYLGFSCSLRNDVFTLHGLKRKGGMEYIVKRGGLTGVDVINRNPNNRISFSDMMERLERIRRGGHEKDL